ncbi:hypothetical protein QR98_0104760 [Sarcoptes scabiei]|uniref:Uncharacterized protein n=1 Tax=Sarcoptes scabiei TaxID=52283 RepID=A0A132ALL5_SARSC|nr:hypothetical protein QR98_0104760 [Sarcoptes scabiei]
MAFSLPPPRKQSHSISNAIFPGLNILLVGQSSGLVPQITRLNVQCDRSGMKVNVEFDNAFNGIIFSKGHFSDPNCR